jgi:hypothetical protein
MRRGRVPLVLALLAAGLGGWIWLVERRSESTDEAARDARRVTRGLARDQVTRIELDRGGESIVLERAAAGADEWRLRKPVDFPADRAAVDELLSGLEFLERTRVLEGARPADYGLDHPRVVVRTRGGPKSFELAVGTAEDAAGRSVYVERRGDRQIFAVDKRFREQVDKSADELRDRRVVPLDRATLARLSVGAVELRRDGAGWRLGDGVRADPARVGDLEKALEELRATRFLPTPASAEGEGTRITADGLTLTLGGPCPGHAGERAATRRGGGDASLCVKAADADRAVADRDLLRDRRLLAARPEDVKSISIDEGGRKVVLAHQEGTWKLGEPAGAAEEEAVRKWLEDVAAFRALALPPVDPARQALSGGVVVTLELEGGGRERLQLGRAVGPHRFVRRGDEPVALEVHAELGALVAADPLLFRSRRMLSFVRFDARRLVARQGGVEEVAVRGDADAWKLKAPVAMEADADATDKLLTALADLRAVRLLAQAPAGALDGARVLEITVEPPPAAKPDRGTATTGQQSHRVEVGAKIAGGCVARVDGGPPFVVAEGSCAELRAHLASRKLLALVEDRLAAFELTHPGGRRETLEKRGPAWYSGTAPVEQSKIDALVGRLRALNARDAALYGPDRGHGLDRPRLVLRIRTDGSPDTVLTLGAATPSGDVYARVSGREVTYLISREVAGALEKSPLGAERSASN